jgi:hypothetical protein
MFDNIFSKKNINLVVVSPVTSYRITFETVAVDAIRYYLTKRKQYPILKELRLAELNIAPEPPKF